MRFVSSHASDGLAAHVIDSAVRTASASSSAERAGAPEPLAARRQQQRARDGDAAAEDEADLGGRRAADVQPAVGAERDRADDRREARRQQRLDGGRRDAQRADAAGVLKRGVR